jgi:hypothetical protein
MPEEKRGSFKGAIRIPLHASLFLFNDLAVLCIPCKSLRFLTLLFSIPTAPTNHPICLEHLSNFARRQKAAIRNKMSLLGGTDGSSNAKSDCGLNCSSYFEDSQASSTVKDKLFEVLQQLRRRARLLIQPRPSASHVIRTSSRLGD